MNINNYSPNTGRVLKEDNTVINTAEMIESIYKALVVNNNAGIQLTAVNPTQQTATIPTGATGISAGVDLAGKTLLGYYMPAVWVAAGLTFQSSPDGVNFYDIRDTGDTEIAHVVTALHFYRVSPADWVGVRYIKLRSGIAAAPVNQTASRDIILVTKAV